MKKIYYGQKGKKATKTVSLGHLLRYPSGFYLHLQISGLLYNYVVSTCFGMRLLRLLV